MNIISQPFGCVDFVSDSVVQGWVEERFKNLSVKLYLDNVFLNSAIPDGIRFKEPNVSVGLNFRIFVNHNYLKHVHSGKLRASVQVETEEIDLPFWPPLISASLFMCIDFKNLQKGFHFINKDVSTLSLDIFRTKYAYSLYGMSSPDQSVVIGRNGYYFLFGGTNNLSGIYDESVLVDTFCWLKTIKRRQEIFSQMGIKFTQLILPEKNSVLSDFVPFKCPKGSKPYNFLIGELKNSNHFFCDVFNYINKIENNEYLYLRNDSHFSSFGARFVTFFLLQHLGFDINIDEPVVCKELFIGDLALKFSNDSCCDELITRYKELTSNGVTPIPTIVENIKPNEGNLGSRVIWRSKSPLIDKTVVCFGNSFFERGYSSTNLTWWFSRIFSEFHFLWTPNVDINYIKAVKPDVVICQTIERFLTQTPLDVLE